VPYRGFISIYSLRRLNRLLRTSGREHRNSSRNIIPSRPHSMSSKQGGKGGAAAAKSKKPTKHGADEKREDVLQAVVSDTPLHHILSP